MPKHNFCDARHNRVSIKWSEDAKYGGIYSMDTLTGMRTLLVICRLTLQAITPITDANDRGRVILLRLRHYHVNSRKVTKILAILLSCVRLASQTQEQVETHQNQYCSIGELIRHKSIRGFQLVLSETRDLQLVRKVKTLIRLRVRSLIRVFAFLTRVVPMIGFSSRWSRLCL